MKILEIRAGRYRVGAVVRERGDGECARPLHDALSDLQATEQAAGDRLLGLFDQVANAGLSSLNSQQFHQIDQSHGIYEFRAGRLRVLFFNTDGGRAVICTHLFMKKSERVPDSEKQRAIRLRRRYDAEGAEWMQEL